MKIKWLNRAILYGGYICLALGNKEAKAALKHCGEKDMYSPTQSGSLSTIDKEGKLCFIVCLNNIIGKDLISVHGLIVHEATHVLQQTMRAINEPNPGKEIEAYIMQCVSQVLMDEFQERVVVKKNVVTKIIARHEKRHLKTK